MWGNKWDVVSGITMHLLQFIFKKSFVNFSSLLYYFTIRSIIGSYLAIVTVVENHRTRYCPKSKYCLNLMNLLKNNGLEENWMDLS
jgi:hypothetical protein